MAYTQNDPIRPAALSVHQAARYTSLSRSTLYRLQAAGTLRVVKVGHRTVWMVDDLDRYLGTCIAASADGGAI